MYYWWASVRELNFSEPAEDGNGSSSTTNIEVGFNFQIMRGLVKHGGNLYVGAQGFDQFTMKTRHIHVDFGAADDEIKQLLLSKLASYNIRNKNFKEDIVDELIFYARNRDITVPEIILEVHLKQLFCHDVGDESSLGLKEFDPVYMDTVIWPSEKIMAYENEDDEVEICTVCLEEIPAGMVVSTLMCSHTFHTNCILEWLYRIQNCPNCRFEALVHPDPVRLRVLGLLNDERDCLK